MNIAIFPPERPIKVAKGEPLILSCQAPGLHDYLTWYKRTSGIDEEIDGSVITRSNQLIGEYHGILTINIRHAKLSDAGTYVCVRFLKLEGIKREKATSVLVKGNFSLIVIFSHSGRGRSILTYHLTGA